MKRIGVIATVIIAVLFFFSFAVAENSTINNTNTTSNTNTTVGTNTTATQTTQTTSANKTNTEKGFSCLIEKVKPDCSGAKTIQELALVVLASPNNVTASCIAELEKLKKTDGCFGVSNCDIRDTALAILALNHAGKNVDSSISWLKNQTIVSSDLTWYLQQNSEVATSCEINYDSQLYAFSVQDNKKISVPAGNCLSLAQSNYWFMVNPACYEKEFIMSCASDFIATLMYKQPGSQTLYVLSETKSAGPGQTIDLKIKSTCFGKTSCDYEASIWSALALKKTGNSVQEYLPYLVSGADANSKYLPNAFLHMIVDYTEHGSSLIAEQQPLNYWEAKNTAYNKYYDTALALLALDATNQQQVTNARKWLIDLAQDANGCWNSGSIKETAFALWALERRLPPQIPTSSITYCEAATFFCIASAACPSDERLDNYYCKTGSCCKTQNLKTCSELKGKICPANEQCSGIEERTSDTNNCCTSDCEVKEVESECALGGGLCRTSCLSTQKANSLECLDSGDVCCKAVETPKKKSLWWLWLLLILLIILIAVAIWKRNEIKVWIYKKKSGFKEDNKSSSGMPPGRPGMPPMNGPQMQRPIGRPLPTMMPAGQLNRPPQNNPNYPNGRPLSK